MGKYVAWKQLAANGDHEESQAQGDSDQVFGDINELLDQPCLNSLYSLPTNALYF